MPSVKQSAQQYWDDRSELFGNYYIAPTWFDRVFRKGIFTRVAVAVDTAKQLDRPTVLDVGSGPGINSVSLIKNAEAKQVTGIDFAPNMVEYAEAHAREQGVAGQTHFIDGDFLTHDFGDDRFDLSIALGVLDYTADAAGMIRKMSQLSTKAFVISWPQDGFRMQLRRYRYKCPVYAYTEEQIRSLHEACDLRSLEVLPYDAGWATIAWKK